MSAENFGEYLKKGLGITKNYPTFLTDAGHGGVIDGIYQTSGKRSPVWEDGRQLFEGEFNRDIVNRLMKLMSDYGIPHINLVNTEKDVPLEQRISDANDYYENINQNCIYLSVHANAGGGTGHETFTYKPKSKDPKKDEKKWEEIKNTERIIKSEMYANIVVDELVLEFPELKNRGHKRANFAVTRGTKMPSFLIECAFMDTLTPDFELLNSDSGRQRFANAIFKATKRICESTEK